MGKLKPIKFRLLLEPERSALAEGKRLAPATTTPSPEAKTLSAMANKFGFETHAFSTALVRLGSSNCSIQLVWL